jgi:hypothetical protein
VMSISIIIGRQRPADARAASDGMYCRLRVPSGAPQDNLKLRKYRLLARRGHFPAHIIAYPICA